MAGHSTQRAAPCMRSGNDAARRATGIRHTAESSLPPYAAPLARVDRLFSATGRIACHRRIANSLARG
ncbi:hypothetical protein BURMUCGD1_4416 [Burkholderia multivorans CGD1]|nr:hypothetical protein BURMUCGD1_4416 [Burkholderia multivorans CGD1]